MIFFLILHMNVNYFDHTSPVVLTALLYYYFLTNSPLAFFFEGFLLLLLFLFFNDTLTLVRITCISVGGSVNKIMK